MLEGRGGRLRRGREGQGAYGKQEGDGGGDKSRKFLSHLIHLGHLEVVGSCAGRLAGHAEQSAAGRANYKA
jgi:hypothetical protein